MNGDRELQYDYIYGAYEPESQRAFISQDFKLIHYPTIDKYRLYDLDTDPLELNDLAGKAKYEGTLSKMKSEFSWFMGRMADPLK